MKKVDVLKFFGSSTKVAKALNISDAAVSKWPEIIPRVRAMDIARITDNKLKYVESKYFETVSEKKKKLKKRG